MKIKIVHDKRGVYKDGEEVDLMKFKKDYEEAKGYESYLDVFPIPSAVELMCDELGIEYKIA